MGEELWLFGESERWWAWTPGTDSMRELPWEGRGAVSRGGDQLLLLSGDRAEVRDLAGETRKTLDRTPDTRVTAHAFSADDRWAILAGQDGTTRVFDARTGALRAVLRGHSQRVVSVISFGARLWTASWDSRALTWDLGQIDASPAELAEKAQKTWGLDLADVMD